MFLKQVFFGSKEETSRGDEIDTLDKLLEKCPFLTENTFSTNSLHMESLLCEQQFLRRENLSNKSLAILNQCVNENSTNYQPQFQRAKWVPWWYQVSYFHKELRKLAQSDLDKSLMILSIQKAAHKNPDIVEYPNWIITLFQAWKHIVNANFGPAETLLNSARTQKDYFDKQVQTKLDKLNVNRDDKRLYFYFSEVEPHYSIGYHYYYNSQFPKALEEFMAIWKMSCNTECDYKSELPPEFRSYKQSSGKKRKIEKGSLILNPYHRVKVPSMIGQAYYHIANDENTSKEDKEKLLKKALKFYTISIIMTRNYKSLSGIQFSDVNTFLQREAIYRDFGRLDLSLGDLTSVVKNSHPYFDILSMYYAYEAKKEVLKKMIEKITSDEAYSIITEKYREFNRLTEKVKLVEDILNEIYNKLEFHRMGEGEDKVVSPYIQICRTWNTGVPKLLEKKCDYFLFSKTCQYVPLIEGFNGVDVPINIEHALLICDMRLDFAHRYDEPEPVLKKYISHLSHLLYRTIFDETTCMMYSKSSIHSMFITPGRKKGISKSILSHFSDITISNND